MSDEQRQYTVVIHNEAAQMMYSHFQFLANVSIPAAQRLRTAFYDAFTSLENMPHRCPAYHTRKALNAYRQLVIGRYQIVFAIDEEAGSVNICYVFDSRQDNDI